MTANDLLMQFQADVLDVPGRPPASDRDHLPRRRLRGRTGGRLLAGPRDACASQLDASPPSGRRSCPKTAREAGYRKWKKAVERTMGWIDDDDA